MCMSTETVLVHTVGQNHRRHDRFPFEHMIQWTEDMTLQHQPLLSLHSVQSQKGRRVKYMIDISFLGISPI